jgi:hypothetical protein
VKKLIVLAVFAGLFMTVGLGCGDTKSTKTSGSTSPSATKAETKQ